MMKKAGKPKPAKWHATGRCWDKPIPGLFTDIIANSSSPSYSAKAIFYVLL